MGFVRATCVSLGLLSLIAVTGACSAHQSVKAPPKPSDSFFAQPTVSRSTLSRDGELVPNDRALLGIKKSALEKEFIIHASLIPQIGAATSQGLQGRIVAFRQKGDKVYLLEATQGHVVTRDLPSTLILAELPVALDGEDMLLLDFNAGMRQLFTTSNFHATDGADPIYKATVTAAKVNHSYIDSARVLEKHVEIRQIAQFEDRRADRLTYPTFEVRYFIAPYQPTEGFEARETSDFKHVGFFEVAPTLEEGSGKAISRIARWDDRSPIPFYVSSNTPPEYVQAVKDGILYWNSAFGRKVLEAKIAPAGVTAPDARYNLIQWVPNDAAGFAYADALMDPRTGEILHAQAYMTSVFAVNGKTRVPPLLRRITESRTTKEESRFGLSFLPSSRLCEHELDESAAHAIERMVADGADDATLLRVSQDYVRQVIAHEVGHTLGLRHNFAGSLGVSYGFDRREQLFKEYLLDGVAPMAEIASTSVMDYIAFTDAVMTGAQIRETTRELSTNGRWLRLPYDQQALAWGYEGKAVDPATAPLFCTDSHRKTFPDCVQFDLGQKPLVSQTWTKNKAIERLHLTFAESFIRAKTHPDPRERLPVRDVVVNPTTLATEIINATKAQVSWLLTDTPRMLSVERKFPYVSSINAEDALQAQLADIDAQVAEACGIDEVLFNTLPSDDRASIQLADSAYSRLEEHLARAEVRNGLGYDGKRYSLSNDEIAAILAIGHRAFAKVDELVLEKTLEALASGKYADTAVGAQIEQRLLSVASAIVLAQTDESVAGTEGKLKKFKYKRSIRVRAAKLLSASLGASMDWSMASRAALKSRFKEVIEKMLEQKLGEANELNLPRPVRLWVMEQKEILGAI